MAKATYWIIRRINPEYEKMVEDLMAHYGHNFSSLVRWLIKNAWEEIKK